MMFFAFFLISGRIADVIVGSMTKRYIPDTHVVIFFDHGDIVRQPISVFQSDEDGSFTLFL